MFCSLPGPGWFTFGSILEIGKPDALVSQLIKVWGTHFASKISQFRVAKIVGYNKYYIGSGISCFIQRFLSEGISRD